MTLVLALASIFAVSASNSSTPCCGTDANTSKLDVAECLVQVNGRTVYNDVTVLKAFDRGEGLEVEIEFVSLQDAEDVQVIAFLTGYKRGHKFVNDVFDMTPTFDVEANVSYKKTLNLKLPDDFEIDSGDELKLRVQISDKYSSSYIREYNLKVEALRESVIIQDIILDPAGRVQAGRGLFAAVRIKNMGEDTEESLRVEVLMPVLGIKATEYIDELDSDEATTSEDMFLRLPACAEAGTYVVRATVTYADGDESVSEETTIEVGEDPSCQLSGRADKTVVTVPGNQDVVKGSAGSVYPLMLQNNGATDRSYELSVSGLSWGTYRFDPGSFVLVRAGETKTVYLYVTANNDAQAGEKVFMVTVGTAGDQKQIALTANVVGGESASTLGGFGDVRKALEIGVIVLIVLLIVLGLIVGFNKLKGNNKEEEGEVSGQTYY
ncbi:MAG: FixG Ig-like domain-containing protein [Nanoarchaeota archaeon]